jgi:hypothetical protein
MPTNKELEQNLIEMAKAIKELAQDVAELKASKVAPVQRPIPNPTSTSTAINTGITSSQSGFPVPPEYREIVSKTLNKYFGMEIEYTVAGFMFTIIVPEKYSTLTDKQKELIKVDKRTKLIPNFEGVNGVRTWAELVYSSFSNEFKSLITADR